MILILISPSQIYNTLFFTFLFSGKPTSLIFCLGTFRNLKRKAYFYLPKEEKIFFSLYQFVPHFLLINLSREREREKERESERERERERKRERDSHLFRKPQWKKAEEQELDRGKMVGEMFLTNWANEIDQHFISPLFIGCKQYQFTSDVWLSITKQIHRVSGIL